MYLLSRGTILTDMRSFAYLMFKSHHSKGTINASLFFVYHGEDRKDQVVGVAKGCIETPLNKITQSRTVVTGPQEIAVFAVIAFDCCVLGDEDS